MIKKCAFIFFWLLFGTYPYPQGDLNTVLKEAVQAFERKVENPPLIVDIGNFLYADKQIGTGFSKYLQDKLTVVISRSEMFEVLSREKLEEIIYPSPSPLPGPILYKQPPQTHR